MSEYNYEELSQKLLSLNFSNFDPSKPLTVLWFGGGQDSTALLLMSKYHEEFKAKYCQDNFVVIMSNTGNEFPETYEFLGRVEAFCETNGIPYFFLKSNMGFHTSTWLSLQHQFRKNNSIMSVVGIKSCTDSLKIQPCYKFLDFYIGTNYGWTWEYKRAIKSYFQQFGKIKVIIGFAKGEEKRVANSKEDYETENDKRPLWMQKCVEYHYPLIDYGMDRADCQNYIREIDSLPVPMPSNCMFCMFQSPQEILYLESFHHKSWLEWIEYENNKIQRDTLRGVKNNLGVKGNRLLPEFLENAKKKFGHLTDQALIDYKFSHGHCVQSKI